MRKIRTMVFILNPLTSSIADLISFCLRGITTSNKILSCDSVIDGAFFPQSYFYVPEKKMCHHAS